MNKMSKHRKNFCTGKEDKLNSGESLSSPTLSIKSKKDNEVQRLTQELAATRKKLQKTVEELQHARDVAMKINGKHKVGNEELRRANKVPVQSIQRVEDEIDAQVWPDDAINKERKRLYDVLETLPVYVILLTPDHRVLFANRFFRERFGDAFGMRCYEYLFSRTEPCEVCETYSVLKSGEPHRWEWLGPDERNYDIYDYPFVDSDGSPMILEMGIDITELKKSRIALLDAKERLEERVAARTAELAESEERYRSLFMMMNEGFAVHEVICDANGKPVDYRFHEINPAFERLTGFSAEAILGKTILEIMPDTEPMWIERYGRVALKGKPDHFEAFSSQLDRWFEVYAYQTGPGRFGVMFLDITERKENQEAIARAKKEWEKTFDSIPDLIAILDDQYRVLRANKAMADRLGCAVDQCVGLSCYKAVHGTDEPPLYCPHTMTLADGVQHAIEMYEERLGGHFLVSTTPILVDGNEKTISSVHVARDITDRRRAEIALEKARNSLEQDKALLQAVINGTRNFHLVYLDSDFNFIFVNDLYAKTCGYSPDEMVGKNHFELFPHEENESIFIAVRDTGIPAEFHDKPFLHPNHPERITYWDWNLTPVASPDGIVTGLVFSLIETTERKQAVDTLRQSEARLRLLYEIAEKLLTSGDPQGIVDSICHTVMAHLDCQVCFSFLVDEAAGELQLTTCVGIPEEKSARIKWLDYAKAISASAAKDGVPVVAENLFSKVDPNDEPVKSFRIQSYACHPMIVQGRVIGTISFGTKNRASFSTDDLALMKTVARQIATAMERVWLIDELQKHRDELETRVEDRTADLKKANEALARSNKALGDFAYVASHDLQEPLRKIQTFADRLKSMPDLADGKARDYLARMDKSSGRMRALIQDLLMYSRLAANVEPFALFNLNEPVEEAVKDLQVLIEESRASIDIGVLPDVMANQSLMRQLFQNLISNAIKYRGDKDSAIKIYEVSSESKRFFEIHVKDNGIGFDEMYLDKIFLPFQRLHGKSDLYRGTGIGLAICRRIVENHGGSITARSQPGKGSTFIVKLPRKKGR